MCSLELGMRDTHGKEHGLCLCVSSYTDCQFCLLVLLRWFHPLPVVRMSEHTASGTMALETLNESLATSAIHAKASHIHIDYAESSDSRLQISAAVCIIDMNFCSILPPVPLHAPTPYYPGTLTWSCIWDPATCPTIAAVKAPLPASTACGWATARPSSQVSLRVLCLELVLAPKPQQWKQSTPSLL